MNKAKLLNSNLLLVVILVLFLFTRLYKIWEIPVSVYWDEASIGYNAYSIAQTGKDEWGEILPLHFRAFGEFKLPVYIYAAALSVKLFGLNAFSVRLPAVLFSLGVVILTYFLAKKLSDSEIVGLLASFFVSISPWFFIFSRTGYEATAGLMFYLLAIYLFLLHTKNPFFLLISVISFILSAYSYNSFRIISPLTLAILTIFEIKNLTTDIRKLTPIVIISVIFIFVSFFPIYRLYVYDTGNFRFNAVRVKSTTNFFTNYLSHFSPIFLLSGDKNLRSQQFGFGQIYLLDLPLILLGVISIYKSKLRYRFLPILLLLIAPIPAAITKESPHALRSLSAVPFICMIVAMGTVYISRIKKNIIAFAVVLIFLGLFVNYFINFLNIYPAQSAKDWQYDYKKIFTQSQDRFEKENRILISDKNGQPYIFALFYLNYEPEKFRAEVVRNSVDKWGFSTVKSFGKFEFGEIKN